MAGEREHVERRKQSAAEVRERAVVGRRVRRGPCTVERRPAALIALRRRATEMTAWPDARCDLVDARLMTERGGNRPGEAVNEPLLAVEVVHRESTAFRQMTTHRGHRLAGEEVALESNRSTARDERERVGEGEENRGRSAHSSARGTPDRRRRGSSPADPRTDGRGGGVVPRSRIFGSISTASTCLAPRASASATSLPVPAPTTSNVAGRAVHDPLIRDAVLRVVAQPPFHPRERPGAERR